MDIFKVCKLVCFLWAGLCSMVKILIPFKHNFQCACSVWWMCSGKSIFSPVGHISGHWLTARDAKCQVTEWGWIFWWQGARRPREMALLRPDTRAAYITSRQHIIMWIQDGSAWACEVWWVTLCMTESFIAHQCSGNRSAFGFRASDNID